MGSAGSVPDVVALALPPTWPGAQRHRHDMAATQLTTDIKAITTFPVNPPPTPSTQPRLPTPPSVLTPPTFRTLPNLPTLSNPSKNSNPPTTPKLPTNTTPPTPRKQPAFSFFRATRGGSGATDLRISAGVASFDCRAVGPLCGARHAGHRRGGNEVNDCKKSVP